MLSLYTVYHLPYCTFSRLMWVAWWTPKNLKESYQKQFVKICNTLPFNFLPHSLTHSLLHSFTLYRVSYSLILLLTHSSLTFFLTVLVTLLLILFLTLFLTLSSLTISPLTISLILSFSLYPSPSFTHTLTHSHSHNIFTSAISLSHFLLLPLAVLLSPDNIITERILYDDILLEEPISASLRIHY